MATLYFDCFSGASGDMILGALIDAGLPIDDLRRALGSLAVDRDAVWTERVTRAGVSAVKLHVRGEAPPADAAHEHAGDHHHSDHEHHHHDDGVAHQSQGHASDASHRPASAESHRPPSAESHPQASAAPHHHVHRTVADIGRLIDGSALSSRGKARAKALFRRLGEAEAAIHGMTIEQVHLHEVGALDSIIDIVGTVYALEAMGIDRVVSSPLNVGSGRIRSAHGLYPVPAPATVRLLQDAPIYAGSQAAELVTPTGALLVTDYAESYGLLPAMRLRHVGYGAGTRDFPDTPNVLRVVIGEADAVADMAAGGLQASGAIHHRVVVIEAEIDDMNPQIFGVLMDRLLREGALDVFYTAIQMKKNRPGTLLTVIAPPEARERLASTVFRETTTIGVRYREMARECLDRETITVDTPLGPIRIKLARRKGEVLNAAPEFDDCARIAADTGRPVKDVQAAAMKAFLDVRQRAAGSGGA